MLLWTTIVAGFNSVGILNFSINFFWITFLLGFTYLTAIFGNLWGFINPFKTIFELLEKSVNKTFKPLLTYPKWLGYYPALLTYFGLIWLELLSHGFGIVPDNLSRLLLAYTFATLIWAYVFGKESWFKYGELFSVFFDLVSKISGVKIEHGKFSLRAPFSALQEDPPKHFSLLLFILFMLSSTGFDGFRETIAFRKLTDWLPSFLTSNFQFYQTIFLALSPFILLSIYLFFIYLTKKLTASKLSVMDLGIKFAYSLIPIAVGYNAAHYFSLLFVQGPTIIPYLSDPFNLSWNLFGTAHWTVYPKLMSAFSVWYIQVFLIVGAHIAAVYTAHVVALKTFKSYKEALISQYPMLVLMVCYTMGSLWIIAQPLSL